MRTKTGNTIFAILQAHVGRSQAISAADLARALGMPARRERQIRRILADEAALWPNVVICSAPGAGYFCAETYEEICRYDNWLFNLATEAKAKLDNYRANASRLGFKLPPEPLVLAQAA